MKNSIFNLAVLFTLVQTLGHAQVTVLNTVDHAMDLIYGDNVSKELIIDDTRFKDGKDESVDILRFDNVRRVIAGRGPLIISSKEPIPSDPVGIIPLKMDKDSLTALLKFVDSLNTNIVKRVTAEQLFRVTYRCKGSLFQYYIAHLDHCVKYFKVLEKRIREMRNEELLQKFYSFLGPSGLIRKSADGPEWKY